MATPGGVSPLVAAFAFGIAVNAASAALFVSFKAGNGSIFRDGQRLVLVTFLLGALLWAQVGFITTTLDAEAATPCSIAAIFTTVFDQLARFSIEQVLLWAINSGTPVGMGHHIQQAVLVARFALGFVFVGFTRPQPTGVCAPVSSIFAVAIAVVILDTLVLAMLTGRAYTVGIFKSAKASPDSARTGVPRSKAVLAILAGFAIWTATSVPLLLGISTLDLILRTALPAAGITILIIIATASVHAISNQPKPRHSRQPESPTRQLDTRDLSSSGSEDYPPMRYEDLKRDDINVYVQPRQPPPPSDMGMANTTMIGVGGLPVTGALFPPMRAATEPAAPATRKIGVPVKQGAFDANGRVQISQPILEVQGNQNPLNKIPTMDLAAAAEMDRQRRQEALQLLQRESALIAKRPAPQPPSVSSSDESMMRSLSLKRKTDMTMSTGIIAQATWATVEPMPVPMPTMAKTTSAQLSPGADEIRRRSPRHTPELQESGSDSGRSMPERPPRRSEDEGLLPVEEPTPSPARPKTPPPPPAPVRANDPPKAIGAPTMEDRANMAPSANQFQSAFYVPIRPSRKRPDSIPKEAPEPPKTLLQRRPTIGLPGNPRAKATVVPAAAAGAAEANGEQGQQTIMFVNSITYNDPEAVQDIIDGASNGYVVGNQDVKFPLKKSQSVVNRPRPIPRKPEKDRVIFPADPSPNQMMHRRTRSGGSIASRRSILQSAPGSPTKLPPLPPPPKTATGLVRPQPNDTRSMTFDEKMNLFYDMDSRDPPVPAVPNVPSNFFDMSETNTHRDDDDYDNNNNNSRKSRTTHRTTKSSFKTESILGAEDLDEISPPRPVQSRYTELSNPAAEDDIGAYFISGIEAPVAAQSRQQSVATAAKRASSPVIPALRNSAWTEASESRTETDTHWGSLNSPTAVVSMHRDVPEVQEPMDGQMGAPAARQEANGGLLVPVVEDNNKIVSGIFEKRDDGRETMMFMLDPAVAQEQPRVAAVQEKEPALQQPPAEEQEEEYEDEEENENEEEKEEEQPLLPNTVFGGWHRRVGDECPTFSERKEKMRSRMPPPIPLLLNGPSTRNPVILKAAEPSPLESPEHALQMIQAQLRKIDQPNRDSVESQGTRLALLENLEKEMDMQQGHWQDMKVGLSLRDSLSTVRTSPTVDSRPQSIMSRTPGMDSAALAFSNLAAERRATRRSVATSVRSSLWQQHLAEAEEEFADNAPDLLSRRDINLLTLSQVGSPTPPDTDDSLDRGMDMALLAGRLEDGGVDKAESVTAHTARSDRARTLWEPVTKQGETSAAPSLLWAHIPAEPSRVQAFPTKEEVVPSSRAAAAPRKGAEPLTIESSQLWKESRNATKRHSTGLWQPRHAQRQSTTTTTTTVQASASSANAAQQKPPRPVTVRPPRRSRRMTLLPDIIEDPQPLPDKRGTLGIFQFPWGEKSDNAAVQVRQPMFAIPGTMTSGGPAANATLQARSRQLEETEYSSSFFDDYEDEDEGDNIDDSEEDEEDSDNEFDETTLWEIASLLKTDATLPSKNSLLPPRLSSDADADSVVDEYMYEASDADEAREPAEFLKFDGIVEEQVEGPMIKDAPAAYSLWAPALAVKKKRGQHDLGVAQPDSPTWESYDQVSETIRSQPRHSEILPIESTQLWAPAARAEDKTSLWSRDSAAVTRRTKGDHGKGLAQPDEATWSVYDATRETCRAKPRKAELSVLDSQALWIDSPVEPTKETIDWSKMGTTTTAAAAAALVTETARASSLSSSSSASSPVSTTGFWTASSVAPKVHGDHGKGVSQPDEATWKLYDTTTSTARAKPRQAEPARIESSALWISSPPESPKAEIDWSKVGGSSASASPTSFSTTSASTAMTAASTATTATTVGVWAASGSPSKSRGNHGQGLPQPSNWEHYDAVTETARAKTPRQAAPPTIESSELWGLSPSSARAEVDWIAAASGAPSAPQQPASAPFNASPKGVWMASAIALPARGDHGKGLPQPADWEQYDGVTETARAKPRQAELTKLESSALWVLSPTSKRAEIDWSTVSSTAATTPGSVTSVKPAAQQTSTGMWSVASKTKLRGGHGKGLPQPANWQLYDTTTQTARSKPRQAELTAVESSGLWVKPQPTERAVDWSQAAVVKAPHKMAETHRSGPSTPPRKVRSRANTISPAHSIRTSPLGTPRSVKVDNWPLWPLWAPPPRTPIVFKNNGGLFQSRGPPKPDNRTTDEEPAAIEMERNIRVHEFKALDRLESTRLWAPTAAGKKQEKNWIMAATKSTRASRKAATWADWQLALYQAQEKSYRSERRPRPSASADDWSAALEAALAMSGLSRPLAKAPVDRSHRNVRAADWDAALDEAMAFSEVPSAAAGQEQDLQMRSMPTGFSADADIMAQIQALEEERMFIEQTVGASATAQSYQPHEYQQQQQQQQQQEQPFQFLMPQVQAQPQYEEPQYQEAQYGYMPQQDDYWMVQQQQQQQQYAAPAAPSVTVQTGFPSAFVGPDGQIYHYPSPVEQPQGPSQFEEQQHQHQQQQDQTPGGHVMLRY